MSGGGGRGRGRGFVKDPAKEGRGGRARARVFIPKESANDGGQTQQPRCELEFKVMGGGTIARSSWLKCGWAGDRMRSANQVHASISSGGKIQ